MTKYQIIFDIVHNLDSRFALLKECVLKEVSKIYFNPATLLDIPDLQTYLINKLDAKSLTTQYRMEIVTLSKKIPVHAAKLVPKTERVEWSTEKTAEFMKEVAERTLSRKLGEDKSLDNTGVIDNNQIKDVIKKHNTRVCFNCMSPNCFTRRSISQKLNLISKSPKGCKDTQKMKFGKMGDLKLSSEFTKKKNTAANMQAKFSTPLHSESKIHETMEDFSSYNDEDVSHGFRTSPTHAMGVIAKVPITEAILPKVEIMERTANVADKYCIICLKQRMNYQTLVGHLLHFHDGLSINAPLSNWLEAE